MTKRMIDFTSIATHKFLWKSQRQVQRKGTPDNYSVFVKPDAACTESEIAAIRSLINLFHDHPLRLPRIKAGWFFLSGESVDIAGLDDIRRARSDRWRDLPGDALEFGCGTPPAVNFFRMDAIMNRLAAIGIPCTAHVDIGQGDYGFYGLWDRGLAPEAVCDTDAVVARYREARTRLPDNQQEREASEARSKRIMDYASELRSILPPAPPPKANAVRMPFLMNASMRDGWVDTRRRYE